VLSGQRGLLGYDLEEGFETDAIKIDCDQYYVDPAMVMEKGYEYALEQSQGLYHEQAKYGRERSTSTDLQSGSGVGSDSGVTVGDSGGPD